MSNPSRRSVTAAKRSASNQRKGNPRSTLSAEIKARYADLPQDKQVLLTKFIGYLNQENLSLRAIKSGMKINWQEVGQRLVIVAMALELPPSEVDAALKYKGKRAGPLVDFARRYHQSLDWLIMGNIGSMCHALAFAHGWRPSWWMVEMEGGQHVSDKAA